MTSKDQTDWQIREIVASAVTQLKPKRIILFGSRAVGTARRDSDIDLAFDLTADSNEAWNRFVVGAEDEFSTLLNIDFVNLSEASAELRHSILKTGVVLYESN